MKTLKQIFAQRFVLVAFVCAAAWLLAPAPAAGQSSGPVINECNSDSVPDPTSSNPNAYIFEQSICVYGDTSGLNSDYSSYDMGCGDFNDSLAKISVYDNGTLSYSGPLVGGLGCSPYASYSFVPNLNDIYTFDGVTYDAPDSEGGIDVQAQVAVTWSILYPGYKVTSIVYDTPGNNGQSGFVTSTTDGTRTSISDNFTQGTSTTFNDGFNFLGLGGTANITFGEAVTTGESSQVTDTFSQGTSVGSASQTNPINHSQDMFLVWLNPAVAMAQSGSSSVIYSMGTQTAPNGKPGPVDTVTIYPNQMQGSNGTSNFDPSFLNHQYDAATGHRDLPGLASICANLNTSEYNSNNCQPSDQCGCKPSDFSTILAQDPLLTYGPTDNPLNADTSGSGTCGQLPSPPQSARCRYLPLADQYGYPQTTSLQGPSCQTCDMPINGGNFSDQYLTAQEYSEGNEYDVSESWALNSPFTSQGLLSSWGDGTYWKWSNTESSGKINGYANTMKYTIETSTVNCNETVGVFYDTVYHTYVFQDLGDNGLCQ